MVVKGRAMIGGVAVGAGLFRRGNGAGEVAGGTEEGKRLGLLGHTHLAYLASFRPIRDPVSKPRWTTQG